MTEEKNKFVDVIAKLIELTQKNKIKWEATDPKVVANNNPKYKIGQVFIAEHKGKWLRIHKYSFETTNDLSSVGFFIGQSKKSWETTFMLEITDERGNRLWKFPYINALGDLFSSIEYQAAGVIEFIDDILGEK